MISQRRLRDKPAVDAARSLAQLLAMARAELPGCSRVCATCQHVYTPVHATDARCDACRDAAAEREAVRL